MLPKNKTLYIIGNGFDLHHRIPSSYFHFGEFLQDRDPETYEFVVQYFHSDENDFWSTFEQKLADLDTHSLLEDASQFLVGYGADDWSDAYHHDYQYEIDKVVSALSSKLLLRFAEWVRQLLIPLPPEYSGKLLRLDKKSLFLTFNYTPTLTRLYGIPADNILYLHGKAVGDGELVLGHGWTGEVEEGPQDEEEADNFDPRIQQGDKIIKQYFTRTFKPTERVIQLNQNNFDAFIGLERIFVFGHSLGNVDFPYFLEILKRIDAKRVLWTVSYFQDVEPVRQQFEQLGIDSALVKFVALNSFSLS